MFEVSSGEKQSESLIKDSNNDKGDMGAKTVKRFTYKQPPSKDCVIPHQLYYNVI